MPSLSARAPIVTRESPGLLIAPPSTILSQARRLRAYIMTALSSQPPRVRSRLIRVLVMGVALAASFVGEADGAPWNDPYPHGQMRANTIYGSFAERPKHLDPARSYGNDEQLFIGQIYEPPLQYHLLKRPYALEPLTLVRMPRVTWLDVNGAELAPDTEVSRVAFTRYEFELKPGIRYQPHPAFARDAGGAYRYHDLPGERIAAINRPGDFAYQGSRELLAEDFVYAIKRLADPARHSPIAGLMGRYIVGFAELSAQIKRLRGDGAASAYLDLRPLDLDGVRVLGRYRYAVRIKGVYPQFLYWQAMTFFAPVPWEADRFYAQPGLEAKNVSLDWYPIGTGAYYLTANNPNLRMVLARNPNFHGEFYPDPVAPGAVEPDAGKALPFIDSAVYSLEKESIPRWNKFLQGYYDDTGLASVSSDNFDQAVQFAPGGEATLSDEMRARGIELSITVASAIYYMGFNMLDPVVGGTSERARLLRRAISIAVDFEEYISIFQNGRGLVAQGPLPPNIFGYLPGRDGINPYVYDWVGNRARRKPIDEARALMTRAGYANGIDSARSKPLVLYYEAVSRGPDDKARMTWMRNQFKKLGIQLLVRATDYNRFRDKMIKGTGQIYMWGWGADYPDPENFLFLLYGPNGKAEQQGENASNYSNPEFDALFDRMKTMVNSDARLAIIREMVGVAQRDAPWVWGYFPKKFALHHAWLQNFEPDLMARNTLKYQRIDPGLRAEKRSQWNAPVVWPLVLLLAILAGLLVSAVSAYRRRERGAAL